MNTRTLGSHELSGVQRYTAELLARLSNRVDTIAPGSQAAGIWGHGWEQTILPRASRGRLLFSPANTGPITYQRQIVTIHDVSPLEHPEWNTKRFAAWYAFFLPRLAHAARLVLTVSEYSKQRILEHTRLPPDRVMVVPIGVDARFHPMGASAQERVAGRIGLPSQRFLLAVGANSPRKNLPGLLHAWRQIAHRLPDDVWLVVVGLRGANGVFSKVTPVLHDEAERVRFTGRIDDDDLAALYSSSLALVFPSLYEGFGLPPLEAMASGTPVICSNGTSLPEVVGAAGLLVDPTDVHELAGAMERIVEDSSLRTKLARAGISRSREFTWKRTAELTWKAIESLL